MNTRSRELAEEAGLGDGLHEGAGIISLYAHFDLEKFAELLVLKCAKIARDAQYSDRWEGPVEDQIKQYFGINHETKPN